MNGRYGMWAAVVLAAGLGACARSVLHMRSALDRVGDDRAVEYPGVTVATEGMGHEYHHERIVLTAGGARWRLLVERHASIWRMPDAW